LLESKFEEAGKVMSGSKANTCQAGTCRLTDKHTATASGACNVRAKKDKERILNKFYSH